MTPAPTAILAPLAAAAAILLVRRGAAAVGVAGAAVSAAAAGLTLATTGAGAQATVAFRGLPGFPLLLLATPWTAALSAAVGAAALCVFIYAIGYLDRPQEQARFFAALSFFAAAMQGLVLSGDFILLLACWEMIGFASWLLIGFEQRSPAAVAAADRAFLITRTADLGLYLAVFLLFSNTAPSGPAATAIGLLLLFAAMGKSAQLPFQGWLQGAMVAPTPVSALLHSATLVAAGAILMIRAFPLLPADALLAMGLAGGVTAVATGAMAIVQRDLKRLLAASTSSQLGFMFLALGAGARGAAAAHLLAHAAMKSALFLGAGVFQHARGGTGFDVLAGAGKDHPWIFAGFAVAALALAGVPPLTGFFSKDAILASAFASRHAPVLASLAIAASVFTAAYLARALRLLWQGPRETGPVPGLRSMGAGLTALSSLAAVLGIALYPLVRHAGFDVPPLEPGAALGSGLAAVAAGLIAGWRFRPERVPAALRAFIEAGFPVAGGLQSLVVAPVLRLSRRAAMFDAILLDALFGAGGAILAAARAARRIDAGIERGIVNAGRGSLAAGRAARTIDERALDAAIDGLARRTVALGGLVRGWQSGLVFRELAVAAAGVLALLLVLGGSLLAGG